MKKKKLTLFIKPIIFAISVIILLLAVVSIYSSIYKILNDTSNAYIFNNTLFLVKSNYYYPDYKKNDYLLLNKKKYYFEGDRVVYLNGESYGIARIVNYNGGTYTIVEGNNKYNRVDNTMIVGKIKANLHKSGLLISSPLLILALAIFVSLYFVLGIYEKDS